MVTPSSRSSPSLPAYHTTLGLAQTDLVPWPLQDKQRALGDKMDLASYLLKPVQRMGKYALLLQDLVKEAGRCPTHEQELGELKAAEDMVRFQLRHGNDLLAMDAVRGCDVSAPRPQEALVVQGFGSIKGKDRPGFRSTELFFRECL